MVTISYLHSTMNIHPNELTGQDYELLDQLNHQELIPFVQTYLKKSTLVRNVYYALNLILFGLVGILLTIGLEDPNESFWDRFSELSIGMLLAFTLIPLHEYIHVLAYRSQGAKNTSYDMNLKKFYFMALAHEFVANKKEFFVVALAPVVVISILLIGLLILLGSNWSLPIIGTLLAHTAMSSGDFGLLNYFLVHSDKEVVTYDDVTQGISYFYGKKTAK